jgi:4-aminobutyrate aminotransferase-like enzyme/Ser/Thr protein kinase RdoA (MazF antagonist)
VTELETDPLRAAPPAFGPEEAARIAERVFGLTGSLSRLPSERDENYRVDAPGGSSFVLKISNPADVEPVVEMQTAALLHVARQDPDLPVVRVVETARGGHWAAVEGPDGRRHLVRAFTFLSGRNPVTTDLDARALETWGAVVARLGRALRGFFHPAARQRLLWDIGQAPALRPLVGHVADPERRSLVDQVLDRFDRLVAPSFPGLRAQVVHQDMSLDNVLVDDGGTITGITDFGDMTHTALACDLAVTLADVLDGRPDSMEMAEPMVAGYASVTPLEDVEAAVLGDLVAARLAAAIVISAWRLDLYPENAEYVSTFGDGAWRFLRLVDGIGFDEFGRGLREVAGRGRVPYRPIPTDVLFRRRLEAMGGALSPLSYRTPLHLVRGEGVWVFDPDGRRYLDAYNNVPSVGHGHPRVVAAIADQARLLNTNTRYLHEAAVTLAERLEASLPGDLGAVLFVNSGSEANDLAWRIATTVTGRRGAAVSSFAYHGVTSSTGDLSPEEWEAGREPAHVERFAPPDGYRGEPRSEEHGWAGRAAGRVAEAARSLAARQMPLAAAFIDSAFTSDGILCPPDDFLREAARAVHVAGGLLVADEVQAGHGRTGDRLWSFAAHGVVPDMVTFGKPMGNGHPVAAVVMRRELAERYAAHGHLFSTFGGNPVACAAALAVLDVIDEEGLQANALATGAYLRSLLDELRGRHDAIGDVRGRGLLVGVDLVLDRATREPAPALARSVVDGMRDRGVLIGSTGPADNVLKIRPPLVFAREHADLLAGTLDTVLAAAAP